MHKRKLSIFSLLFAALLNFLAIDVLNAADQPNIIFIMADDLGYGDLGCYGQKEIKTPQLDQMAAEGMRFTQFYAGCTVCAPSRSALMTGQHTGHTWVRGNAGGDTSIQSLRDGDVTIAEVLKARGYQTGLIGKWGLGEVDEPGFPLAQGFDSFFGYLNQVHAHNYYPEFLYRNRDKVQLRNVVKRPDYRPDSLGGTATKRVDYSHDLFAQEALQWVEAKAKAPFFLYLALTIPHANNEATRMTGNGAEVPDFGIYDSKDWPDQDKGQAAMITRMDKDIGRLFALLKKLGIDDKTLVLFTSDNGPHNEAGHNLDRFDPAGPLTGIKRSLTEGGVRVPLVARWPGTIKAGTESDHICYAVDVMPTLLQAAGIEDPAVLRLPAGSEPLDMDGISFLPTLTGMQPQPQHDYLYWEFYEQGSRQSVRFGKWAAIRQPMLTGEVMLYDLSQDLQQRTDVASKFPGKVAQAVEYMEQAHVHHPNWKPRGGRPKPAKVAK